MKLLWGLLQGILWGLLWELLWGLAGGELSSMVISITLGITLGATFFKKKFLEDMSPFCGATDTPVWTSGDVSSGFQRVGSALF